MMECGVNFDRQDNGNFALGKEGGHTQRRILYSKDTTGKEISSKLLKAAQKCSNITIFEDNNNLSGKITWMLNPNDKNGNPKTDPLNPNKELRERPRLGMVIMKDFAYQKDNIWDEGTLYDPKKGKTYSGKITLKDKNTLDLRGYIGVPALGRSSTWTRANDGSANDGSAE